MTIETHRIENRQAISGRPGRKLDLPPKTYLIFLIGVPLFFGVIAGWMKTGRSADWLLWQSLVYWVVFFLITWPLLELSTQALARLVQRWHWPLGVLLLAGNVVGAQLMFPVSYYYVNLIEVWFGGGDNLVPFFEPTVLGQLARAFDNTFAGLIMWLAVNYGFFYFAKLPRFGHEPPTHLPWEDGRDALMPHGPARHGLFAKLKPEIGRDVWAVKAERHYLRVYTAQGEDFIHYRLSDAVAELENTGGLQVHRSYWLKTGAVEKVERDGRSATVVLKNGMRIPVGRTFQVLALNTLSTN